MTTILLYKGAADKRVEIQTFNYKSRTYLCLFGSISTYSRVSIYWEKRLSHSKLFYRFRTVNELLFIVFRYDFYRHWGWLYWPGPEKTWSAEYYKYFKKQFPWVIYNNCRGRLSSQFSANLSCCHLSSKTSTWNDLPYFSKHRGNVIILVLCNIACNLSLYDLFFPQLFSSSLRENIIME